MPSGKRPTDYAGFTLVSKPGKPGAAAPGFLFMSGYFLVMSDAQSPLPFCRLERIWVALAWIS